MESKGVGVGVGAGLLVLVVLLAGCPPPGGEVAAPPPNAPEAVQAQNTPEGSPAENGAGVDKLTYLTSMEKAQEAAQVSKLPMVVDFSAEWCGWCKKMEEESFPAPAVQALGSRFVWVRLDADADPKILDRYRVNALPTLLILNPGGTEISRHVGYMPGPELASFLQHALSRTESG